LQKFSQCIKYIIFNSPPLLLSFIIVISFKISLIQFKTS
jgi:hypothetical protein